MPSPVVERIRTAWRWLVRSWSGPTISQWLTELRSGRVDGPDPRDPFRDVSWVYAALDYKARNISRLPVQIVRGDRRDPKAATPEPRHPMLAVFERPNPAQSGMEFLYSIGIHLDRSGACVIAMPDREPTDYPTSMWATSGALWKPILSPEEKLIGWEYMLKGQRLIFAPWQVVIVRHMNPDDPWGWLSPFVAMRRGILTTYRAELFNETMYANQATPGGFLSTDQAIGDEEARSLLRRWEDRYGGASKAGRTAILHSGLKYESAQLSQKDMQYLQALEWDRDRILITTGVWPEVFGLGNTTFANREEAKRSVWTDTLVPLIERIEHAFWHQLFWSLDDGAYWLDLDTTGVAELQLDYGKRLEQAQKLWGMGMPVDDASARFELGLEPFQGSDVGYLPFGLVPVEQALAEPEEPEPAPGQDETPAEEEGDGEETEDPDDQDEPEEAAARLVALATRIETGGRPQTRAKASGKGGRRWMADLRAVEKLAKSKLSRHQASIRAEILRGLSGLERSADPGASTRIITLADVQALLGRIFGKKLDERIQKLMEPVYEDAVSRAGKGLLADLGRDDSDWEPTPETVEIVRGRGEKIVGINETTRERIQGALAKGLEDNENVTGLQARVREAFNADAARSLTIARTESAGAMNEARFAGYETEGIAMHEWVASMDEATRETHKAAHGKRVAIGQPFPGVGLRYPNDPEGEAGEVINCRCRTVPVIEED